MATAEEAPQVEEGFTLAEAETEDVLALADEPHPVQSSPDPVSKQLEVEGEEGEKKGCGKGVEHSLKSVLFISGAVVAAVGAIFAIVKKIKAA